MAYRWSPEYFSRKEIREMTDAELLNAFEGSIIDETKAQNFRDHVPPKLSRQVEMIREELLNRLRK